MVLSQAGNIKLGIIIGTGIDYLHTQLGGPGAETLYFIPIPL
jgi:hypothetical protein